LEILVSFCNLRVPAAPTLVLYDPNNGTCRVLKLPAELGEIVGITGLGSADRHLYAVVHVAQVRGRKSVLVIFDATDLSLLRRYDFCAASDVHSIWAEGDAVYAVSSGTDEVMKLLLRGTEVVSEEVFWRPEPNAPRKDHHHLNSITGVDGQLLVSGFGRRSGEHWQSARHGFIQSLASSETIVRGIEQPHSVLILGEAIAYCESRQMAVRVHEGQRAPSLAGYTRGLCRIGDRVFAATSVGRRVSRSSGQVIDNPSDPGELEGRCTISTLSLDGFAIEATMDMTAFGKEIYDLLPVERCGNWPVTDPA